MNLLIWPVLIAVLTAGYGHNETGPFIGITPLDVRQSERYLDALELFHDFTTKPDGGVAATVDSGQTWTQTASSPAAVPTVVGGRFTDPDTGAEISASYLTVQLGASATYMEAEFEFGSTGSTDGENVGLIAASADFPGDVAGIGEPPDMAMQG